MDSDTRIRLEKYIAFLNHENGPMFELIDNQYIEARTPYGAVHLLTPKGAEAKLYELFPELKPTEPARTPESQLAQTAKKLPALGYPGHPSFGAWSGDKGLFGAGIE